MSNNKLCTTLKRLPSPKQKSWLLPLSPLIASISLYAQPQLPDTIARVKSSIVMVGTHTATGAPAFSLLGSGFAVGKNLVATNAHVVSQVHASATESRLVIRLQEKDGGEQLRGAVVVGSDSIHDLSLLKIDGPALPPVEIGNSKSIREGDAVAFIGFPIGSALGFSPVTHRGIISAITSIAPPSQNGQGLTSQRVRAIRSGAFEVFQLDATAYPGNSGGPLFAPDSGKVIGVINMVFVKGAKESALSQPSGITYAIPSEHLRTLIQGVESELTVERTTGRK